MKNMTIHGYTIEAGSSASREFKPGQRLTITGPVGLPVRMDVIVVQKTRHSPLSRGFSTTRVAVDRNAKPKHWMTLHSYIDAPEFDLQAARSVTGITVQDERRGWSWDLMQDVTVTVLR
ncbi:MAG TPA: hypothetical protein VN579_07505 [Bryobacteraceae bacterium]|nr:hypothetical protein [Bryobacteraceae bacterium]